jgi:hypothetical protein
LIIGFFCIFLGLADLGFEPAYRLDFGHASYSTEAVFRLPDSRLELVVDRRCIHLFLAEYERTLVLRDKERDVLRLAVAVDTGSYSGMRVYRVSASQFFLQGDLDFDRYLLDISKPSVARETSTELPPHAQLIGTFDRDEKGWRFIFANTEES